MDTIPGGNTINRIFTSIKNSIKYAMIPDTFFESMGFEYIGPVDGPYCGAVRDFNSGKDVRQAGAYTRGHKKAGATAIRRSPEQFHGVEGFDIKSGERVCNGGPGLKAVCSVKNYARWPKIQDIVVDRRNAVGRRLCGFAKKYRQVFDVGIAEEHGSRWPRAWLRRAAPVCGHLLDFIQRAFDQIMHDVGIMSLRLFSVWTGRALSEDGRPGNLRPGDVSTVPGMRFICRQTKELKSMLAKSVHEARPAQSGIRGARGGVSEDTAGYDAMKSGTADITIVTLGRLIDNVLSAAELLKQRGYSAAVVKLNRLHPLPLDELLPLLSDKVLVCEEVANEGSAGVYLAAALAGTNIVVKAQNCGSRYIPHGTVEEQMALCGLDAGGIAARAEEICVGR